MANQIVLLSEILKAEFAALDTRRVTEILDSIDLHLDQLSSDGEIELTIDKVFNETGGITRHLEDSINRNKLFKAENVKIFKILIKLIDKYGNKIAKYASKTIDICSLYLSSRKTTAFEKENAAVVIHKFVVKKICPIEHQTPLMEQLLRSITSNEHKGRVLRRIFELIGYLSEFYPDCIQTNVVAKTILEKFINVLERSVLDQVDLTSAEIIGALKGLQSFLVNFTPSEETQQVFKKRLYKCVKNLSSRFGLDSRREMQREALTLLQSQANLFSEQIYDEYEYWHQFLETEWLTSNAVDVESAVKLFQAIHGVISNRLSTDENNEQSEVILKFFIDYFVKIFEKPNAQRHEIRIAFRGMGLMAKPCYKLKQNDTLEKMMILIMQRAECESTMIFASNKESLEHFPDYVQTLSQILEYTNGLSNSHRIIMRSIIVLLIRNFPLLSKKQHKLVIETLINTFHNLLRLGGTIFNDVLEPTIYQGIIWTCSHKLPIDVQEDWKNNVDWKEQVTFHSFLPLWNGLLASTERDPYIDSLIRISIFDRMIETLFAVIEKLNLNTKRRKYRNETGEDLELFFSDPNLDLEPEMPKDFHIFFNVVDFYCKILNLFTIEDQRLFVLQWLPKFIRTAIYYVIKYPLISGFLKLLKIGFKISEQSKLFDGDMSDDCDYLAKDILCFVQGMITKTLQCNGELQVACMKLVLSSPTYVIQKLIIDLLPVFEIAFEIERVASDISISHTALSAIERYVNVTLSELDELKKVLIKVLPCLNLYLQGFSKYNATILSTRNKRAKRKVLSEPEMHKFQKRILSFLANLQPHLCNHLLDNDDEQLDLVKWSTTQNIFPVLFFDSNGTTMNIILDSILPQICLIATTSTDRQKKMSACELIHATILYIIGSDIYNEDIWRELCQQMLVLGCDADTAVQQMFEPLVMQITHYMSRSDKLNSTGFDLLLSCLIETVSHPSESVLRDFSARCIRELLTWSIKQSIEGQMSNGTQRIISTIFQQINLLNTDLIQSRRNGACIAFNNLYRILREEDSIISHHCFELFYGYCMNFMTSDDMNISFNQSKGNLEQVSASLDHLVRMIIERRHFFNVVQPNRFIPKSFGEGKLENVVEWLFLQWSSNQIHYRRKIMEIFKKLVVCVDGYHSAREFLKKKYSLGSIAEIIEGDGISKRSDLSKCEKSHAPLKTIRLWLQEVLAVIECYYEIVNNGMIENVAELLRNSKIFGTIHYFLEHVFYAKAEQLALQLSLNQEYEPMIMESERLNELKEIILLLNFALLTKLLQYQSGAIPELFWTQTFSILTKLLSDAIYSPHSINFDSTNPHSHGQIREVIEYFCTNINRHATKTIKESFFNKISLDLCDKSENIITSINFIIKNNSVSTKDLELVNGINFFYRLQTNIQFMDVERKDRMQTNAQSILYKIFEAIVDEVNGERRATTLQPDTIEITSCLLQTSLYQDGIAHRIVDLIMNQNKLKISTFTGTMATVTHGNHFFKLFKTVLSNYFVENSTAVIAELIRCTQTLTMSSVIKVLIEIIEYAHKYHSANKLSLKNLVIELLKIWSQFVIISTSNETEDVIFQMLSFLSHTTSIYPQQLYEIRNYNHDVERYLLKILRHPSLPLNIKSNAVFLLTCILDASNDSNEAVVAGLKDLRCKHFPMISSELRPGTVERLSYENTIQSLLDALNVSKSPILLEFLMDCTSADEKHIREHEIADCLNKLMASMSLEQQTNAINLTFEKCLSKRSHPSVRMMNIKRYLTSLLRAANVESAAQFYEQILEKVLNLCAQKLDSNAAEWTVEQTFVTRIGAFKVMELFTCVIPIDRINAINIETTGGKKKILSEISQKAYHARKEEFTSTKPEMIEWYRKFQCAAYNCELATLSNSITKLSHLEALLFTEKPSGNLFIWCRIINTTDDELYTNLTTDLNSLTNLKRRMISVVRDNNEQADIKRTFMFSESQNIFRSSLSQDVSRVDMSNSLPNVSLDQEEIKKRAKSIYVLRRNSVNDHEVMATLCATIEKMFEKQISPISEESGSRRRAPTWVRNLCEVVASDGMHKNIRIFLATAIDNCSHWFRYYAKDMTLSILKFLSSFEWHQGIELLVVYLLIDLIEWNQFYPIETDEEIRLANGVLKDFISKAWTDNRIVFIKHTELIKALIEIWSKHINISSEFYYNSINRSNDMNLNGFYLNYFALKNDIPTWTNQNQKQYLTAVIVGIKCEIEEIYLLAAQILGFTLDKMINKGADANEGEIELLIERIRKVILSFNESKMGRVIYAIHKHYVNIVDKFQIQIQHYIPKTSGKIKRAFLEMFQSRISNYVDRVYQECLVVDVKGLLQTKEYQLIALHIINKIMPMMKVHEIHDILPHLKPFTECIYADCRDVMYEIMIYIRDNAKDDELHRQTTNLLMEGINDPDENIRKTVFAYWSDINRMPHVISERLFHILNNLYDANVEGNFLQFCTQFLLMPSINHPEANNPILRHHNKDDSKLVEYTIDTESQHQNSYALMPLFIESQQKKSIGVDGILSQSNYLRATVDTLAFAPTIDPTSMHTASQTFLVQTKLFSTLNNSQTKFDRRSNYIDSISTDNTLSEIRERFFTKNSGNIPHSSLKHIVYRNQPKPKVEKITLYRRYRFGDYPDFLVNSLAFLLPLQNLCRIDSIVARHTFIAIVQAICKQLSENRKPFLVSFGESILRILNSTKKCNEILFSALTEIVLHQNHHFSLEPEKIFIVTNTNNMTFSGILLLEKELTELLSVDGIFSLRSDGENTNYWINMANMYYRLSEIDVVGSIFGNILQSNDYLLKAIEAETYGNLPSAIRSYSKAFNELSNEEYSFESDFIIQSHLQCLEYLGDWSCLEQCVGEQYNDIEELWTDEWNKTNILPFYVHSGLRNFMNGYDRRDYIKNVDNWLRNDERAEHMRNNFSEELALLCIANNDYPQSKYYSEHCMQQFLDVWKNISMLPRNVRFNRIAEIRKMSEIYQYTEMFLREEKICDNLSKKWNSVEIEPTDSLKTWESLASIRQFMCDKVMQANSFNEHQPELEENLFNIHLKLIKSSLKQNNHGLASNMISLVQKKLNLNNNPKWMTQIAIVNNECQLRTKNENGIKIESFVDALLELNGSVIVKEKEILNSNPEIQVDALYQSSALSNSILDLVLTTDQLDNMDKLMRLQEITSKSNEETNYQMVFSHSKSSLDKCIELTEQIHYIDSKETSAIGDAHCRLATFCFKYCNSVYMTNEKCIEIAGATIKSVCCAIRYGSKQAQIQLPRLLSLTALQTNSTLENLLNDQTVQIPTSQFFTWANQILSYFDFEKSSIVDSMVLRMAQEYPQTMIYPFYSSYKYFIERKNDKNYKPNEKVQMILDSIRNPKAEKMLDALHFLCLPENLILTQLKEIQMSVQKNPSYNNDLFQQSITNLFQLVFENKYLCNIINMNKYQKSKKDLQELSAMNFDNNKDKVKRKLNLLQNSLINIESGSSMALNKLSPWLHEFQWHHGDVDVELPLQLIGEQQLRNIPKIVKFGEKIEIFNSLRKPIKLKFICSNGKAYDYLVKYGEDLRQDQRIQHIFHLMNQQLANDRMCIKKNLVIKTYSVIPLDSLCGLISFVENSIPIANLFKCNMDETRIAYRKFIALATENKATSMDVAYGEAALKYTPLEIADNFEKLQKFVPQEMLRKALLSMSSSPESFFVLRRNFLSSFSVMNIANWILGIGDRHLNNVLMNKKNGKVIGIDFNMSFGNATRQLPIPELIPFRLTPQIVSVNNPLRTEGLIRTCMSHALRVFQLDQDISLAYLEIFIKEPLFDWSNLLEFSGESSTERTERQINDIKDKLNGINPIQLFENHLQNGYFLTNNMPKYIDGYVKVLHGHKQYRTTFEKDKLNVEEQVTCLIELATDPTVLGIMSDGAVSWL